MSDYIRGTYWKDGSWEWSTYGYQWVTPSDPADQIIGNTVDGRRVKGVMANRAQDVAFRY